VMTLLVTEIRQNSSFAFPNKHATPTTSHITMRCPKGWVKTASLALSHLFQIPVHMVMRCIRRGELPCDWTPYNYCCLGFARRSQSNLLTDLVCVITVWRLVTRLRDII
jgi:hypothetical protein